MNNSVKDENSDSQNLLNQIVIDYIRDQKRANRWRWFMRALIIILILIGSYFLLSDEDKADHSKPHVGLIDLEGTIAENSAENFIKGSDQAYSSSGLKALIIRINSSGGSAVQADYIYNAIRYYRNKYSNIKVYAVCVDMCASAAYYFAAAADEIYANPSSLVGSIGVLYNGFGLVDTLQKIGMTRRLQTAGVNKGFYDPFSPIKPEQTQYLQELLDDIHHTFIDHVKEGRGNRLRIDDLTFSGLFWTGQKAKERGLIDGFASSGQVARDVVKVGRIIDYTYKQSVFDRMTKHIGASIANQLPVAMGLKEGIKT